MVKSDIQRMIDLLKSAREVINDNFPPPFFNHPLVEDIDEFFEDFNIEDLPQTTKDETINWG